MLVGLWLVSCQLKKHGPVIGDASIAVLVRTVSLSKAFHLCIDLMTSIYGENVMMYIEIEFFEVCFHVIK